MYYCIIVNSRGNVSTILTSSLSFSLKELQCFDPTLSYSKFGCERTVVSGKNG